MTQPHNPQFRKEMLMLLLAITAIFAGGFVCGVKVAATPFDRLDQSRLEEQRLKTLELCFETGFKAAIEQHHNNATPQK